VAGLQTGGGPVPQPAQATLPVLRREVAPYFRDTPSPGSFISVADKGLTVVVSGLESTVAGGRVSVDSKRVCRR
jgi:hypothetical protein